MYDSFNEPTPEPSGARTRPGLALAVLALAAAGTIGAAVGGAAWTFDRYTGSASADDPTPLGVDGVVRTSPPTSSAPAGTPGWAETLVLPVQPSVAPSGSATAAADTVGRLAPARPGPVAARGVGGNRGEAAGGAVPGTGSPDPGPAESTDPGSAPGPAEPQPGPSSEPGTPGPGASEPGSGDPGTGDPGSLDPGPAEPGPGESGAGDPGGDQAGGGPSAEPGDQPDPIESAPPAPTTSPAPARPGRWFFFRG